MGKHKRPMTPLEVLIATVGRLIRGLMGIHTRLSIHRDRKRR
jgi:hypothetical protein